MKQSASTKRAARIAKVRYRQARLGVSRLVVHTTGKHTYAQIISPDARVLVSASTVEKAVREKYQKNGANMAAATDIGLNLAKKAVDYGLDSIGKIGFDRGFKRYQGRVKALAEAAREGGLKF